MLEDYRTTPKASDSKAIQQFIEVIRKYSRMYLEDPKGTSLASNNEILLVQYMIQRKLVHILQNFMQGDKDIGAQL